MNNGKWGWIALGAFVAVWDLTIDDSLSAAFDRGMHSHRPLVILVYATTTAHLFGKLPRKADPFYILLDLARR